MSPMTTHHMTLHRSHLRLDVTHDTTINNFHDTAIREICKYLNDKSVEAPTN